MKKTLSLGRAFFFVNMKVKSSLVLILLLHRMSAYGYIKSKNPLKSNYSVKKPVTIASASPGLSQNILPQSQGVRVSSDPRAVSFQTSVTTTEVAPAPAVSHGHSHPIPNFPPPAPTPHPYAHAHGSPYDPKPQPAYGTPHMHSGHPYIAPAVAPQRMTYQQIVEYLANTNGANLSSTIHNGSGNTLLKCKAYCDTLPPSPVCDASNVLYRNECEAKCVSRKADKTTLRYGICCCSSEDHDYSTPGNVFFAQGSGVNLCISTCIFNCLGGEAPIEAEHNEDYNGFDLARSSTSCQNIK